MSAGTQASYGENKKCLRLLEKKTSESRPLTPPSRKVLGEPVSKGLIILPPDTGSVHFNSAEMITTEIPGRKKSADRVERKLNSVKYVEKSNSAGGSFTKEKCCGCSTVLNQGGLNEKAENGFEENQLCEKTVMSIPEQNNTGDIPNEGAVKDDEKSSENPSHELPIELTAEFLSCVMNEDYQKALNLCEEILSIDPDNQTCFEFQDVIREKLKQNEQCQDNEEDEDSSGETDSGSDDDDDEDEEEEEEEDDNDDSDSDDDSESEEDDESSESSSDSGLELNNEPINLLMGGLPLRTDPR